jgi:dihydroxy-acid dehydratase
MSYSLVSRDIMAAMVEIHALGHPHDGMVLISGNDKSVPAHLVAMARCDLPATHLPGGTQLNAPDYVTSDKIWPMGVEVERGDLPKQDLEIAQRGACPTCGACQFMGSASTASAGGSPCWRTSRQPAGTRLSTSDTPAGFPRS